MVRRGHPVLAHRDASGHIAPFRLADLPRVVLSYPDGQEVAIDDPLAEHGRGLDMGDIITPYFLSAPLLVTRTDRILCMSRLAARLVADMAEVELIDFPEAGQISYCAIWHERAISDPGVEWVRKAMAAAMTQDLPSSSPGDL